MTFQKPPRADQLRDKIVCAICNFAFRFATPFYREMVAGSIQYGLSSAARDSKEGREPPTHWDQ